MFSQNYLYQIKGAYLKYQRGLISRYEFISILDRISLQIRLSPVRNKRELKNLIYRYRRSV